MPANLFLIPTLLGESIPRSVLPQEVCTLCAGIRYFIVEDLRTARRFLKKINKEIAIDNLHFFLLNKHTKQEEYEEFLQPLTNGQDMAILSEVGVPCIADPGAAIVQIAHRKGIKVRPMVGPSSFLLAMAASGLNGQNFAFNGYLPIEKTARNKAIKKLEQKIRKENQSQIIMDTPFRNNQLLNALIKNCKEDLYLCIAANITLDTEYIKTRTIKEWKKNLPDLHKKPTVFILGLL